MAEEKKLNATEQMQALGHNLDYVEGDLNPDDPANTPDTSGERQATGLDQEKTDEAPQQSQPSFDSDEDGEIEEQTAETSEESDESTDDDPNSKTWQSQYDKTRHEMEQLAQEKQRIEAEKEALMAMLSTTAGSGAQQTVQQPTEPQKKPELTDFIKKDEYYSDEAMDPSTPSGQAYHAWQEALQDWKADQKLKSFEQQQKQKEQEAVARQQAKTLAERYPEFRNPLNNEPNMQKIAQFMDELSNAHDPEFWADLYAFTKQRKSGQTNGAGRQAVSKVGKRANKVGSVNQQSSAEQEKKRIPKPLQEYANAFGGSFEYPADAEFVE